MKKLLAALLLALPLNGALAATAPSVSVLTFAAGDVYWQRFGHNALLVRDAAGERVYNYGVFDFRQKDFFLNFARGIMRYRLAVEPLGWTLQQYRRENRWVREQALALSPAQAQALAAFLDWNARPENQEYAYDYFLSNCSTRVRDALDRALGGVLQPQLQSRATAASWRSEATRLMSPDLWWFIGMDIVVAARGDAALDEWQRAFSPLSLMQSLRTVMVDGHALVAEEHLLVDATRADPPAQAPSLLLPLLALGLLLGALLVASSHRLPRTAALAAFTLNLLAGTGGLILLAIWTLTQHWSWHANHNLLLFDPLCLLLLAGPARFRLRVSMGVLTGAVLGLLIPGQHNLAWIALWLPLHAAMTWRLSRITRSQAPGAVSVA